MQNRNGVEWNRSAVELEKDLPKGTEIELNGNAKIVKFLRFNTVTKMVQIIGYIL